MLCPPMVTVAVRGTVDAFGAMLNVTVPLPLPFQPLERTTHPALAEAVHPHDGAAAPTVMLPLPPPAAKIGFDPLRLTLQTIPDCTISKACPPICIVSVRVCVLVFGATV